MFFQIITKTNSNPIKIILPSVISDSQNTFIPGHSVTKNAMTTFETFHSMTIKKKRKRRTMTMKLDMSKTYERVELGLFGDGDIEVRFQ